MKTPVLRQTSATPRLEASVLEAHPVPTLVVDARLEIVHANPAAKRLLGVREGTPLGDALGCIDARNPGACGDASRCAGCVFLRRVEQALAGEVRHGRGFVLASGSGAPADLHLLAIASPYARDGAAHAILALYDANALVSDPGVVRVCGGCGRIQDEEGEWHPLHRYLEDRLGLEVGGPLCSGCKGGSPRSG